MSLEQPSGDSEVQEQPEDGSTPSDEQIQEGAESEGLDEEQPEEEEELEEDLDGLKVRGKKEQLEKLKSERLMQADYTRKTQEVAAERQAIAAEKAAVELEKRVHFENMQEVATYKALEIQLQQYAQVNWDQLYDENPGYAAKLSHQMRNLQAQQAQLRASVTHRQEQFTQLQQQEAARQLAEAGRVLQRDIPGWSEDLVNKLKAYALKTGYTQQEIDAIRSPAVVKSIYKEFTMAEAKKSAMKRTPEVQEKPVTRVVSSSKGAAVKDPDKMSTEEWMKWRSAQVKRR